MVTTEPPPVETATCNVCEHQVRREQAPYSPDWRCNEDHPRCTMLGCIPRTQAEGMT